MWVDYKSVNVEDNTRIFVVFEIGIGKNAGISVQAFLTAA